MGTWLLSIVGVVTIGVLLDILMPEGETNKYIKGIFSIVVVLVIISPLPKLIKSEFNIESIFSGSNYTIDEGFINSVNNEKRDELQKKIMVQLTEAKAYARSIRIDIDISKGEYTAVKIYLDKSKIGESRVVAASVKAREIIASHKELSKCEVDIYAE